MKKFSFSRLLQNDRLMIILSVLCAIALWYFVLSGSSNITTRTITTTLTTANVKNGNLQVIDSESVTVDVEVQGAWSEVSRLTADDIRVQLNASDIQTAGSTRVHIVASRNSAATDYEILSTSPSTVTLFCDEWSEGKEFRVSNDTVTAEAPLVKAGGDDCDIGRISINEADLPGGVLTVQGPLSIVNKIAMLTARVADAATITQQQIFPGTIVALDSTGAEVDLTYCTLMRYDVNPSTTTVARLQDITENSLKVVVAVNERRTINFSYDIKNAPGAVDLSQIVTVSPASVTLEGEKNLLEDYADQLALLTTLDFDKLSTKDKTRTIDLLLPDGITVVGTGSQEFSVTLKFDWTGYTTKTLTWNIGTDVLNSPVKFQNVPLDKTINMVTTTLSVTVFGKRATVAALKPSDLSATVDMNDSALGTYVLRPALSSSDAWVYYGDNGYTVYMTIS